MTPQTPEPSAWAMEAAKEICTRLGCLNEPADWDGAREQDVIAAIIQSHAPPSGDVKALREALEAWMRFNSETRAENPCPDLALRARYREAAKRLTESALASVPAPAHASVTLAGIESANGGLKTGADGAGINVIQKHALEGNRND